MFGIIDVHLIGILFLYLIFGRSVVKSKLIADVKYKLFFLLNILTLCLVGPWNGVAWILFVFYALIVLTQYFMVFHFKSMAGVKGGVTLPYIFPILFLIYIKYLHGLVGDFRALLDLTPSLPVHVYFIGISYVAFRISYFAMEVVTKRVRMPSLWEYLSFAFLLPLIPVGPISSFKSFQESFGAELLNDRQNTINSLLRILVGAVKFYFVANVINQISFDGLLLDGHMHPLIDFMISSVAFYLFLYFNFSGFCDIAIGASGFMGIRVEENFNQPFVARNVQDFWSRWHITLGTYMKEMLFTPISKTILKKMGSDKLNLTMAVSLGIVFVLVGVWHGRGVQFLIFGVLHAAAVVAAFVFGNVLKKRLGRPGYKAYMANPYIRWTAITSTFSYIALTLSVFANNPKDLKALFMILEF